MKDGTRLYINITNKCNAACPFCCMYSSPKKNTFMNFDTFRTIVDSCAGNFELQLEGGEPLIHDNIFLFIEYAISTGRCMKVIILSNGILLDTYMKRFIEIANWYKMPFDFKISANSYLENLYANKYNKNIYKALSNLIFATEYIEYINIVLNVRATHEDHDDIVEKLKTYDLYDKSNVFYLQSYGKMKDDDSYEKPIIVQNIDNWRIYASDGECFGQDLIARSEHENQID